MIKFRPHKGSLKDSLLEQKQFNTIDKMFDYIIEYCDNAFNKDDIVIDKNARYDGRCNWNYRHICVKHYFDKYYTDYPRCVGMCDLGSKENDIAIELKEGKVVPLYSIEELSRLLKNINNLGINTISIQKSFIMKEEYFCKADKLTVDIYKKKKEDNAILEFEEIVKAEFENTIKENPSLNEDEMFEFLKAKYGKYADICRKEK